MSGHKILLRCPIPPFIKASFIAVVVFAGEWFLPLLTLSL